MSASARATRPRVAFQTDPSRYRHWSLQFEGAVATLALDVDESGGLVPGYQLKLNSYDLGVDIELADALNRIRFEHPQTRCVVITSRKDRVFCSGANILMLGSSSHAWKVNFCKFTNETRNAIEDASRHSGLKFIAAVNGACAGGGYELAMACDEIILIDDRSSTVSLPEVPLLGVLPGTGGLTRLTDKRRVRHDLADVFCTTTEGVRGERAVQWRLVDEAVPPSRFAQRVQERARELAAEGETDAVHAGIELPALVVDQTPDQLRYEHVQVDIDRSRRTARFTVRAPALAEPTTLEAIVSRGAAWWPLAAARQLDDAVLQMRLNEPGIGTWLLSTQGDAARVLEVDAVLLAHREHWLVRETIGLWRRTLSRLDTSSRSLFAFVEPGSCFVGTLLELALAADRSYHLALPDDAQQAPHICLSPANFQLYPMANDSTRLQRRFHHDADALDALAAHLTEPLDAEAAMRLGLVTSAPDDIDWDDEVRLAIEARGAMSPDALTGLEANLRFGGEETMWTRIFGRLSAWQNWIFQRPNAVGPQGALKLYGSGEKARLDPERT